MIIGTIPASTFRHEMLPAFVPSSVSLHSSCRFPRPTCRGNSAGVSSDISRNIALKSGTGAGADEVCRVKLSREKRRREARMEWATQNGFLLC